MFVELDDYSIRDALLSPFVSGTPNYVVIPTNEQNIHGAGMALIIRNAFPQLERLSRETSYGDELYESASFLHIANTNDPLIKIVLVPTKRSPKDRYSELGLIARQMLLLRSIVGDDGIIVMPKIGCGLGGLKWHEEVGPLVQYILEGNGSYANVVIATKRMEIQTIVEGFDGKSKALDLAVYSMDAPRGMPSVVWFGFTEDGAMLYESVLLGSKSSDANASFESLRKEGMVVSGHGSRRTTEKFLDMYNSKRYSHTPKMMWSVLYKAAKPRSVNSDQPF